MACITPWGELENPQGESSPSGSGPSASLLPPRGPAQLHEYWLHRRRRSAAAGGSSLATKPFAKSEVWASNFTGSSLELHTAETQLAHGPVQFMPQTVGMIQNSSANSEGPLVLMRGRPHQLCRNPFPLSCWRPGWRARLGEAHLPGHPADKTQEPGLHRPVHAGSPHNARKPQQPACARMRIFRCTLWACFLGRAYDYGFMHFFGGP